MRVSLAPRTRTIYLTHSEYNGVQPAVRKIGWTAPDGTIDAQLRRLLAANPGDQQPESRNSGYTVLRPRRGL